MTTTPPETNYKSIVLSIEINNLFPRFDTEKTKQQMDEEIKKFFRLRELRNGVTCNLTHQEVEGYDEIPQAMGFLIPKIVLNFAIFWNETKNPNAVVYEPVQPENESNE